ncbi:MAG: hypothetical protein ACO1SV_12235 [Fimbriimonas sp.]
MNESFAERSLSVSLGEGEARLVVELTGSPCACEDLQAALIGFVRDWKRDRAKRTPKRKPCGCKDEEDAG